LERGDAVDDRVYKVRFDETTVYSNEVSGDWAASSKALKT
jgi:hypothetical protein